MSKSQLEAKFLTIWRDHGNGIEPVHPYRFAAYAVGGPGKGVRARLAEAGLRDWEFDFAWPEHMIAVEVDGAVWTRGRHTRGEGFMSDCEKTNAAAVLGWRVIRVPGPWLSEWGTMFRVVGQIVGMMEVRE